MRPGGCTKAVLKTQLPTGTIPCSLCTLVCLLGKRSTCVLPVAAPFRGFKNLKYGEFYLCVLAQSMPINAVLGLLLSTKVERVLLLLVAISWYYKLLVAISKKLIDR